MLIHLPQRSSFINKPLTLIEQYCKQSKALRVNSIHAAMGGKVMVGTGA